MESLIKELPRLISLQNQLRALVYRNWYHCSIAYGIAVPSAPNPEHSQMLHITSRAGRHLLPIAHFVLAIGLPAPGCSADAGSLRAFSASIATRNCHRAWA